jgi:DNA-binding XRE family transcriptional regulator
MTPLELKQARKAAKLTQVELGNIIGCSERTVRSMESGEKEMNEFKCQFFKFLFEKLRAENGL